MHKLIPFASLTALTIGVLTVMTVAGAFDDDDPQTGGEGLSAVCAEGFEDCEDTIVVTDGDGDDDDGGLPTGSRNDLTQTCAADRLGVHRAAPRNTPQGQPTIRCTVLTPIPSSRAILHLPLPATRAASTQRARGSVISRICSSPFTPPSSPVMGSGLGLLFPRGSSTTLADVLWRAMRPTEGLYSRCSFPYWPMRPEQRSDVKCQQL